MAEMKPIGIDQTTGQQRLVKSTDSVVDNIGEQVEIAITQVGDYSGNLRNRVTVLFPWDASPAKLDDPATLPGAGAGTGKVAWSPNGEFLAVTYGTTSPRVNIYQRNGTEFNKLADLATLPPAATSGIGWSSDGEFLTIGYIATPYFNIYQRSGTTFTKLADPSTVPDTAGGRDANGIGFSPNGEFLTVGVSMLTGSLIFFYQRSGTTFTKIADPATQPPDQVNEISWTPNGEFCTAIHNTLPGQSTYQRTGLTTFTKLANPSTNVDGNCRGGKWSPTGEFLALGTDGIVSPNEFLNIYQRSGTTLTRLASPATQPLGAGRSIGWSPNSEFLAVGHETGSGSEQLSIYQRSGTTFTKLADPATTPAGVVHDVKWSPDGQFLAIINGSSPFLFIYQTSKLLPDSGIIILK